MLLTSNENAIDFAESCYNNYKKAPSDLHTDTWGSENQNHPLNCKQPVCWKGEQCSGSQRKQLRSHMLRYCQKQSLQGLSEKEGERWPEFDGRSKIYQKKKHQVIPEFLTPSMEKSANSI